MSEKVTINGVDVIQDGDVTHFTVSDDVKKEDERKRKEELDKKAKEPSSLLKRICRWFKNSDVTPYVKITDMADPLGNRHDNLDDMDAGSDGKHGVECGLKIKF